MKVGKITYLDYLYQKTERRLSKTKKKSDKNVTRTKIKYVDIITY
jgi:hypothetical protein